MLNTLELLTERTELVQRVINCTTAPHETTLKTNFAILQKYVALAEKEIAMQARRPAKVNHPNNKP